MTYNFGRESSAELDYSAEWSQNIQSPDYIDPEPNHQPGLIIAEGGTVGNLTNSNIRQSLPRFNYDNLDCFNDS